MKKIIYSLVMALTILSLCVSCGEDDEPTVDNGKAQISTNADENQESETTSYFIIDEKYQNIEVGPEAQTIEIPYKTTDIRHKIEAHGCGDSCSVYDDYSNKLIITLNKNYVKTRTIVIKVWLYEKTEVKIIELCTIIQRYVRVSYTLNTEYTDIFNNLEVSNKSNEITNLKIIGPINARIIKWMRKISKTNVHCLDLSEASIVAERESYTNDDDSYYETIPYSQNNIITDNMFNECYMLDTLILPNTVEKIEDNAFGCLRGTDPYYGHEYTYLRLPENLKELNVLMSNFKRIEISDKNSNFVVKDGFLWTSDMNRLIKQTGEAPDSYIIPASVSEISSFAIYKPTEWEKYARFEYNIDLQFEDQSNITFDKFSLSSAYIRDFFWSIPDNITYYYHYYGDGKVHNLHIEKDVKQIPGNDTFEHIDNVILYGLIPPVDVIEADNCYIYKDALSNYEYSAYGNYYSEFKFIEDFNE